ncbi:MAG: DNA gyrase inhibitor YacG [Oricola sp.]|nr:DNA gyrase inhibitor YacG [Oricola sp.]
MSLTSPSNDNQGGKNAPCPICDSPALAEYLPFCSKRCADVDLHRWLSGAYAIPAAEDDSEGAPDFNGEPPERA